MTRSVARLSVIAGLGLLHCAKTDSSTNAAGISGRGGGAGAGGPVVGAGGSAAGAGGSAAGAGGGAGAGGSTASNGGAGGSGGATAGEGGAGGASGTAGAGGATAGKGGSGGSGGATVGEGGASGTAGAGGAGGATMGEGGAGKGGAAGAGGPLADSGPQAGNGFRFVSWGDTKSATSVLNALSPRAKALSPLFTIYNGDLVESGFAAGPMAVWKDALNGGTNNGVYDQTFTVRGNHDSADTPGWEAYFNQKATADRVGATNYASFETNRTYSFDVGNSHFVAVDVVGDVTLMTAGQLSWMDADLGAAEKRGLTHAFLYWHGPVYPVAEHCCASNPAVIDVFNKHPSVSATFHGHEHTYAWVHVDKTRYANLTHEFEELITGDAGAGPQACSSRTPDYCQGKNHGFVTVDVSGKSFSVNFFTDATTASVKKLDFAKP
jgi:hypothetical protein